MITGNERYVQTRIHVNTKHGEIVHFRRFDIDMSVDIIIRRLVDEMPDKKITKIQMDKHYE